MSESLTPIQQSVLVRCPGADLDLVNAELRLTLTDFFSRSLIWRDRLQIAGVVGQALYDIPQPQVYGVADMILFAYYGSSPIGIGVTTGADVPSADSLGSPRMVEMRSPLQLQLWPVPPASEAPKLLTLDVVWTFGRTSYMPVLNFTMPAAAITYVDGIADGVLARMYSMPDKPWSNQALVGHHSRRYNNTVINARAKSNTGGALDGSQAAIQWRFPRFAR